jgi:hypothetical protein
MDTRSTAERKVGFDCEEEACWNATAGVHTISDARAVAAAVLIVTSPASPRTLPAL